MGLALDEICAIDTCLVCSESDIVLDCLLHNFLRPMQGDCNPFFPA